jgi:hypothetical protein
MITLRSAGTTISGKFKVGDKVGIKYKGVKAVGK